MKHYRLSAIILTTAAAMTAQTPPGTLVFSDEFNGTSLNPSVWRMANEAGNPAQQIVGYYNPLSCQVHDGSLHLVASNQPFTGSDGKTYNYTSCRIDADFSFLYGHVEFRAKLPAGKGYWPALWIRTDDTKDPINGEIDVIEGHGSNPREVVSTIHYWYQGTHLGSACGIAGAGNSPPCTPAPATVPPPGTDLSADYHVYAIDWTPGSVTWSLDTKPYFTAPNIQNRVPEAVTINLAVGGTFDGPVDPTTPFPAELAVDYVRVYQTAPAPAAISAADQRPALAPEAIGTIFGAGFATATQAFSTLPLPTTLAATTVSVKDAAGTTRPAPLYYVSPTQINFQVPLGTGSGNATVTIGKQTTIVAIGSVAPSLFTINSTGFGVAAATATRYDAAGNQTPVAVFNCTATGCVSAPIDPTNSEVFVSLYGTGIRNRFDYSLQAHGEFIPIAYGGPQGVSPGLDQVNFQIPADLAGLGEIPFQLTVNGIAANPVILNIK